MTTLLVILKLGAGLMFLFVLGWLIYKLFKANEDYRY